MDAAEQQLYGPLDQRDAASAVRRLEALALDGGTAPTHERARALFVLGSLWLSGVLEPVTAWNRTQAQAALRQAAALSLPEARLYAADQLVWRGENRCEYGLRAHLQRVADDLLVQAEQEAHHPIVPAAPVRLRERAMDGVAWDVAAGEDGDAFADAAEQQRNAGFDNLARGDHAAAANAFEAAIAGGDDAYARFNLGYMHMKGLVNNESAPDYVQAEKLLRSAAAKGVGAAYNSLGVMAFNGWHSAGQPNMSNALEWFRRGADAGDPDALFNTGLMYYDGHQGTSPDMHASVDAFQQAHDAGHWRAPYTLSALHRGGLGTPRSCTQAARLLFTWVEERCGWGAAMDDAVAALDRGDVGGAVVQLSLLSAQGCDAATANLAYVLMRSRRQLTPWLTRAEALDRAAALLEASARRGASSDAWVDLGHIDVERRDWAAAHEHFTAAQNAEGLVSLALMHLRGRGNTTANITHARQLLLQAWERAPDDHEAVPAAVLLAALRVASIVERLGPALLPATISAVLAAVRGARQRRARHRGARA